MYNQLYIKYLFLITLISLVLYSCQGDDPNILDDGLFGSEYYPASIGSYWLYQIDSTIYDDAGGTIIESRTFVKEEVIDQIVDAPGDTIFILNRSQTNNLSEDFNITEEWTVEVNGSQVIRTEENLRFVKLVFPFGVDRVWQGNQFDEFVEIDVVGESIQVYKDWGDYIVEEQGLMVSTDSLQFVDVISVLQSDSENDIERRFSKEYYAPHVGLVKKEMIILDTQCICPGESWEEKAEAGFILTQTLIAHN